RKGAHDILGLPDPPTALFTINDMYALGAYAGVRDLGLRVPDSVSVVGFDDIVLADIIDPPLTTVRQPLRDMTRMAVERLIAYLERTTAEAAMHVSIVPDLIVRGSTAPAPSPTA